MHGWEPFRRNFFMSKRKIDNALYAHLASAINQALPLEYAIRAARKANSHEMAALAGIDEQIRQHWLSLRVSDDEIRADRLVDMVWDALQVGFPMARRHGRVFADPAYVRLLNRGLATARETFAERVQAVHFPATAYFRICDLLNGNDIPKMLRRVARCLGDAKHFAAEDDVPLDKFVQGIREPIRLHPGLEYVSSVRTVDGRRVERFGIVLDTEMGFSPGDMQVLVREFLYQFAQRRQALRPPTVDDPTSSQLIQAFLGDELLGRITPHAQDRVNGLLGPLAGLCCWDLMVQFQREKRKAPLTSAVSAVLGLYPGDVGEPGIRRNYFKARSAIDSLPFSGAKSRKARAKAMPKSNAAESTDALQALWMQGYRRRS